VRKRLLGFVSWTVVVGLVPAGARAFAPSTPQPRRFEVTASRYKFEPARIEVRQGDVVELALRSADTDHGIAIKAYAVKVAIHRMRLRYRELLRAVVAQTVADPSEIDDEIRFLFQVLSR
jgi:plastocyanin